MISNDTSASNVPGARGTHTFSNSDHNPMIEAFEMAPQSVTGTSHDYSALSSTCDERRAAEEVDYSAHGCKRAAMGVLVPEPLEAVPKRRGLYSCCCGCSLQAGCIVIGSFGLIMGVTFLYLSLNALCHTGRRPGYDVLMLFYGALHVITCLSLIYGADKRRPSLVKFWLFTRYVEFVMIAVAFLYYFIMMISYGFPAGAVLVFIPSLIIGCSIFVYCVAIVHSFVREITDFENIQPLKEEI